VVFGQAVAVAVGALAALAADAQESDALIALEAARGICLLAGRSLGDFGDLEVAGLLHDLLRLAVLPKSHRLYLKHIEHIFRFCGFPKNLWHFTQRLSDIVAYYYSCLNTHQ
jgi:hypothetical protein